MENHRLQESIKDGIKIPIDGYWGNVPSKICGAYGGAIGGSMVKEMIESYERKLADKDTNK